MSGYCNKKINDRMKAAITLGVTDPTKANIEWGNIDQAVMADSPVAVAFTPKQLDFISSKTKNYHFSLQYKMFVSQLQVK
jgi:peptide/nickel transport system substrate-binding protein